MNLPDDYTQQNRLTWNEVAQPRQAKMHPADFYAGGGYNFEAHEIETLGNVQGLAVLHMPCASGEDTLSLAVLGAQPTGVDISDAAIEIARNKAAAAGLEARFVHADILKLPADLQEGTFDLVYASSGVLCWIPSISGWAQSVAAALKPGGRLILCEHHPLFDVLDVSRGKLDISRSYFGCETPTQEEGLGYLACGAETAEHYYLFTWPLGEIVSAVINAGLCLESLKEFPYEGSDYHSHLAPELQAALQRLPVEFHLVACKE